MQNSVIQKQLNNYVIYCHKNKINSKCYIGITQQKPKRRWQNGVGYKTQNFYRAIEKYGWNNFEHIILEEGLSLEEATKKEKDYIKEFNSIVPNGYNISIGGESGNIGAIRNYEFDDYRRKEAIILETMEVVHGMIEYERKNNMPLGSISSCCIKNMNQEIPSHTTCGKHFMFYDKDTNYIALKEKLNNYVYTNNLSNDIIHLNTGKIYKTFYQIEKELSFNATKVCACCKYYSEENNKKKQKAYINTKQPQIFMYVKDLKEDPNLELSKKLTFLFKNFKSIRPIRFIQTNEWFLNRKDGSDCTNYTLSQIHHELLKKTDNKKWDYIKDIETWVVKEYLPRVKEGAYRE